MRKELIFLKKMRKPLALTLVASMVLSAVPSDRKDAAAIWTDVPETIASESFDDAANFSVDGTVGEQIKFTEETVTKVWDVMSSDGVTVMSTFQSVDKAPEMDGDTYVKEAIDVTPEIVIDSARGSVLELKEQISVGKYPSAAPNTDSEIQSAKTYYSSVEVANPFTAYRDELFEADRFSFDNVAATGTEVERKVIQTAVDGWEYNDENSIFPALRNRYSAPEAKAGVTISFWGKVPYDEAKEQAADTNFFEFYNTESLVYQTDDLAKAWISYQYDQAVEAGTVDDVDSPFYAGEVAEARVVAVNANALTQYNAVMGTAYAAAGDVPADATFKYVVNHGMYMKWNPAAAECEAAYEYGEGQYRVFAISSVNTSTKASNKEIVVDSGRKDTNGNTIYYHLKWTDSIYVDGNEASNYAKYRPTEEAPYGTMTRVIKGATGHLYAGTADGGNVYYTRDDRALKTGEVITEGHANKGTKQTGQHNTYAGIVNPTLKETVEDEEWHYYTVSITDEWFQVYVDGVAMDPNKATAWTGNTFNLGSGMYSPAGNFINKNAKTDWQKLCNDDYLGSIYGQLFGVSVMDFITDENTKLYIGGKTQKTAAGTLVDAMRFYSVALTDDQVACAYEVEETAKILPEAVHKLSFSNENEVLGADGTTGEQIKFTDDTVTKTWEIVDNDGVTLTGATFQSVDKAPEMNGDTYVTEKIDVTPSVVKDDEKRGNVIELKDAVSVGKYPSAAPNAANEIQSAKTYYSSVEVANPFTAYRDELYDAERFTFDNVAATGTEVERLLQTVDNNGWAYTDENSIFPALRNRYSAPEAKAGVTISFWGKVPYDEAKEAAADTNFFEFSNTESLVYKTDDLARAWISYQYDQAVEAGTVDDVDSPFYAGEVVEARVVSVNAKALAQYNQIMGTEYMAAGDVPADATFKYVANHGMYMKWNPRVAECEAAYESGEGQYKVFAISSVNTNAKASNKEIVVESGRKDTNGNTIYYHLKWTDNIYAEGNEASNYAKYRPTEEAPYGTMTQITKGATGRLNVGTADAGNVYYTRDDSALMTGEVITEGLASKGTKQRGQHNTYASVVNPILKETIEDEAWHYYTVSITDEWFQVYVDGVAMDPNKAVAWNGNTFNMGSSMYAPNGRWVKNNQRTDWQKLCNDDYLGSIYGQLFGVSVMDFITDENTKLYIGGKTQKTAAGTMVDSFAFYTTVLNREQVATEYTERSLEADPEAADPGTEDPGDVTPGRLGDVDGDGQITANDSLYILKLIADLEVDVFVAEAADVNGDANISAIDALLILNHIVGLIQIPEKR